MTTPCCKSYQMRSTDLSPDIDQSNLIFEHFNASDCSFSETMIELNEQYIDRYIYIYNSSRVCPCQAHARPIDASRPQRAQIESVAPAFGRHPPDDFGTLQVEVGARVFGYDTLMVDMNRMTERLPPACTSTELGRLSLLCQKLGLRLIRIETAETVAGRGRISPAS